MASEPAFRNVNEMAQEMGISPNLLRRQAKAGRIPHVYVGGRLLFSSPQVLGYLERLAQESVRETVPAPQPIAVRRRRRIVQPVAGRGGGDAA